jgi:hemerythrin-like domain-containing protein
MTAEITQLNSPIDVMYLIHKALRAEAARVEQAVTRLEIGGSFKPFLPVFYRWATELGYHIDVEEKYMLTRFPEAPLCQDTEAEKRLMERLEDLQTYLHTEIGRTMVIARTRRNLFAKVVALRMVQDDLLEAEEESVLPVLRQQLSTAQQLDIARHLLIDAEAQEAGELLEWVGQDLTATERHLLAEFTADLQGTPQRSSAPTSGRHWSGGVGHGHLSSARLETHTDMCRLQSPIDIMYPLHNALRAQAEGMEQAVRQLTTGGGLQPVEQTFRHWARALEYHAVMEDKYMTALLPDRPSAQDNEAAHKRLTARLEELQTALREARGQTAVTARTQRRLLGEVVMLRVAQDDHLEDEEELVLPVIRQRCSEVQQLAIAGRLVLDQEAQHPRWILDWAAQYVPPTERLWLADLVARVAREVSA